MDFAISADHRMEIKETSKMNKYLYLTRELKLLWNMRVSIISIAVGMF